MDDIVKITGEIKSAFEAFKSENDARLKAVEKGQGTAEFEAKLATINATIEKLQDQQEKAQVAMKRNTLVTGDDALKAYGDVEIEHKNTFFGKNGFMRKANEAGLAEIEKKALEFKALSAGSDPDGGYTVPVIVSDRIIKKIYETSPMRQIASVMTISSASVDMLADLDEASAGWTGERTARTVTNTPQVGKIRINAQEMYANPEVSQQLLDDSAWNVESWLADKLAEKFSRVENSAFVSGDGSNKPRGLLSYATSADSGTGVSWGTIGHVATGVSGDFASTNKGDKLIELVHTLKTAYLGGASFLINRTLVGEIRRFKDGNGQYLWQPSLQAGAPDTLLGYAVNKAEDMPAKAANSLSVAFGNFREAYQIVDRMGIRTLRDPYTNKPMVGFYTTKRVGGDVVNFEAFKVLKFA